MDLAFCTLLLTQPFVWLLVVAVAIIQSPVTLLASLLSRRKPRSFRGLHVLISGGSEGIGLELAKQCAARGATVTLVARTRSKLDAARASVLEATPSAKVGVQTADVSQAAQVAQAVRARGTARREHAIRAADTGESGARQLVPSVGVRTGAIEIDEESGDAGRLGIVRHDLEAVIE